MDPKDMTDRQITDELIRLQTEKEELNQRAAALSIELLHRYPPPQVGVPPVPQSMYGGW